MAEPSRPHRVAAPVDPNADLGFGAVVARESRRRLLNRDGSFNVRREGLGFWGERSAYHYLLTISWPKFLGYVGLYNLVANALFAALYVDCGAEALSTFAGKSLWGRFAEGFFFSVHTLATIGYGSITPTNFAANVVVTVESLVGLLTFALVAGIMFARFARPTARLLFSDTALIAPYRAGRAFMFRVVNRRSSQLVELEAKLLLARRRPGSTDGAREFLQLALERDRVSFFPLTWTIVHPIDERSPLWGVGEAELAASEPEFLVLINGFDETFSQTVHTRSSYRGEEVVWGGQYASVFNPPDADGTLSVDARRLHAFDRVPLP
jgi:inward rectifier potassium channel